MSEPHEPDLNALGAHLEGRLEGEERQRTIDHLSTCLECRETAARLSRSWGSVRAREGPRLWWLGIAAAALLGTAVAVRILPVPAPTSEPSVPPASPSSAAVPSPADTPRTPSSPGPAATAIDESLLVKRGGLRRIGGKAFRLVGGEWVDERFDPAAGLPSVEVTGPDQRRQILARLPGLAPYLALGDRVVVVFEGTVYRVRAR